MKHTTEPLQPGVYYHIYNRGNNRENLFFENRNYTYFLGLYAKYVSPIADTYAYCLLKNHLHLLVRIKTEEAYMQNSEVSGEKKFNPSQGFANLFNAYAKAINKGYGRIGSLFEERFGRIAIKDESYFTTLIFYIHYNPQKHGFETDFRHWPWSSYRALTGTGVTRLKREDVLNLFGGTEEFEEFHRGMVNEIKQAELIDEAFEKALA